ncbi:MAG: restriction system-associated AAA family ATPase [Reinekea sp.]
MKLLRLKITDPKGFRSLQTGFEHHFRTEWDLQEEQRFEPFVCAGPNGSGKSNLLEALAAIFYQLEVMRVRRSFLPEVLQEPEFDFAPTAFELDYLIRVPPEYISSGGPAWAKVGIWKNADEPAKFIWDNQSEFNSDIYESFKGGYADFLLPEYVLGYSSGENEILSLPFFKMRFIQFDEYWNALTQQQSYPGHPETRLAYLDNGFSQAILLCNLLFHDAETLRPFREDVGVEGLTEFRLIIRRSIPIDESQLPAFGSQDENRRESIDDIVRNSPALMVTDTEDGLSQTYRVNLMTLLEGNESASPTMDGIIDQLTRCATCSYLDDTTDTLYLDYYVNDVTKQAFRENFEFEVKQSPIALFRALQVLLTLNLYTVSEQLKGDLYTSDSLYVSETTKARLTVYRFRVSNT